MNGCIHNLSSSLFSIFFSRSSYIFQITLVTWVFFVSHVQSILFNFTHFELYNPPDIIYRNDSIPANGAIQLTKSVLGARFQSSVGRAFYSQPVPLWDKNTNRTTNFTTHFSFEIKQVGDNPNLYGDGIAFFLAPFDNSTVDAPENSAGSSLGLVSGHDANFTSKYPFVAVEFDAFQNGFDPSNDHLGIDITSVHSNATFTLITGLKNRTTAHAWITYNSFTKNLSVFITYETNPVFSGESNLSYIIDLSLILPERIRVGFSAATGENAELHNILSWDFNSTLEDNTETSVPVLRHNYTIIPPPPGKPQGKSKRALVGGLVAGIISVLAIGFGIGLVAFKRLRTRSLGRTDINFDVDDDFDQETGPRRFTYQELRRATNNFSEAGKLGEGGFGDVYRGFLTEICREIAVKKISRGSKQGKKEYVSEVKIISRLRHKNLVQLLGWCHERGDLLLVYEFMPNGSLDTHLYTGKREVVLPWTVRYNIAQDLASALLYLHQDWEQCVLHRDVKPSNVMLDSVFTAKLGDFGLARLVDHNIGTQTTVLAGTLGYLAPECVSTGQATKESDVFSFGVVALEIACGRRPIEFKEEPSKTRMIEWVWHLYGEGLLLEAVDKRLDGEFDIQQIECLMVVGLWCCHPEYTLRPSIRQVVNVLNSESPFPNLPSKFPIPIYCSPPTNVDTFYITSTSGTTSGSSGTISSSSQSAVSGTLPLLTENSYV